MKKYNSTTTLNNIREASPCREGWEKLLGHLGKTCADNEPLDLLVVLESNGYDDALWVLSYGMEDDHLAHHFQAWCAEQVVHLFEKEFPDDKRIRDHIDMLRNDSATVEERKVVRAAATTAADAAATEATTADADAAANAATAAAVDSAYDTAYGAAYGAAYKDQEKQLRKMLVEEV